jgi:hypothetical protein
MVFNIEGIVLSGVNPEKRTSIRDSSQVPEKDDLPGA